MKKTLEQAAPSDADLFQQALQGVTPLSHANRIPPALPPRRTFPPRADTPSPLITDNLSDHEGCELGDHPSSPTSFLRNGLQQMTLRKLRRGHWPVQNSIDLHGCTRAEARHLLAEFIHHALHQGLRCVSVIHGKGWRAEGGEGILKIGARHWLTQFPQVLAYCESPANAGGGGAVRVLLQQNV